MSMEGEIVEHGDLGRDS
jgi:hypothetical protein